MPLGVSFQPGSQTTGYGPNGPNRSGQIQQAVQLISTRLPSVVGARAMSPQALLQSPGSAGLGGDGSPDALLRKLLQQSKASLPPQAQRQGVGGSEPQLDVAALMGMATGQGDASPVGPSRQGPQGSQAPIPRVIPGLEDVLPESVSGLEEVRSDAPQVDAGPDAVGRAEDTRYPSDSMDGPSFRGGDAFAPLPPQPPIFGTPTPEPQGIDYDGPVWGELPGGNVPDWLRRLLTMSPSPQPSVDVQSLLNG